MFIVKFEKVKVQPMASASSMIYRTMIRSVDRYVPKKLRPLWEHEAGPKTVFFWAPAIKWVSICLLNFE